MVDSILDHMVQGTGFLGTIAEDEDFAGVHHCANTNSEGLLGHLALIVVEEAAVGLDGVCGQGLDASTAGKTATGLVEGDVAVGAHAAHKEVEATSGGYHLLVVVAFGHKVGGIAIEDMYIFFLDVDMVEEVGPHKAVVAFGVLNGKSHIFVHIEGDDILETDQPFLVQLDKMLIETQRRASSGAAKHKGMLGSGFEVVDSLCHIVGCGN